MWVGGAFAEETAAPLIEATLGDCRTGAWRKRELHLVDAVRTACASLVAPLAEEARAIAESAGALTLWQALLRATRGSVGVGTGERRYCNVSLMRCVPRV
jgi:hypothetical protein